MRWSGRLLLRRRYLSGDLDEHREPAASMSNLLNNIVMQELQAGQLHLCLRYSENPPPLEDQQMCTCPLLLSYWGGPDGGGSGRRDHAPLPALALLTGLGRK